MGPRGPAGDVGAPIGRLLLFPYPWDPITVSGPRISPGRADSVDTAYLPCHDRSHIITVSRSSARYRL